MARKILFSLIKSNTPDERREEKGIDQSVYCGTMFFGPTPGRPFAFYTDDNRYFTTSNVKTVQYVSDDKIIIHTLNSEYSIMIGEEVEPK